MTEVYKVGVALAMTSNAPQVLKALSSGLLGVNAQVKQLTGGFDKLKLAIGGAFAIFAGREMLGAFDKIVKAGDELVHQQNLMRMAGVSNLEIARATAQAYETSARVQTTSVAENLKHLRELRYAFGDLGKAQSALMSVEKSSTILRALNPAAGDQVWELAKALESRGETRDVNAFAKVLDEMTKVSIASGGKVTPQMYFQNLKYGRSAALGWDDAFIGGAFPRLMQELGSGGGGSAGNALMSAFRAVGSGQTTKTAAQEFAKLGLGVMTAIPGSASAQLDHVPGFSTRSKNGFDHFRHHSGRLDHTRGGAVRLGNVVGSDLFISNPYEWVQQVLVPALLRNNFNTPQAMQLEISRMFSNRTAADAMTKFALQGRALLGANSQFEKDIRLQRGSMNLESAYNQLIQHDWETNLQAFSKQFDSLLQTLGSAVVPTATGYLRQVTDALTGLTKFSAAHPGLMKDLGIGLGILGASLVGAGTVALIAAIGPVGWLAGGIIALGAAAVTFGPSINHWFEDFNKSVTNFFKDETLPKFIDQLSTSLSNLWNVIKNMFSGGGGPFSGPMPAPGPRTWMWQPSAYTIADPLSAPTALRSGGGFKLTPDSTLANVAMGPRTSGDPRGLTPFITETAKKYGIDPRVALAVANSEGLYGFFGDHYTSFGAFQLHRGGRGSVGTEFERATGLNLADKANERASIDFAMKWASQHGWGAWMGARAHGITGFYGINRNGPSGVPSHDQHSEIHVHTPVYLDGKKIAHNTMKHIVIAGNGPAQGARLPDYMGTRMLPV